MCFSEHILVWTGRLLHPSDSQYHLLHQTGQVLQKDGHGGRLWRVSPHALCFARSFFLNLFCRLKVNSLFFFFPSLSLFLFMASDSPHIFSWCYWRSPSRISFPWLVSLWCLSASRTSSRPLPRARCLFAMGSFDIGSLHIFLAPFFYFYYKSEVASMVFLFAWIFISPPSPASSSASSTVTPRIAPSLMLSAESSHALSPGRPRSCVAVWVMQVIMANMCAIPSETSLCSGTSRVCLHAAALIGGGIFLESLQPFDTFLNFLKNSPFVCVRVCIALPIVTLWPGSLGPLLPRAALTGDPKRLVDEVLTDCRV